jgi:hypothetical protein
MTTDPLGVCITLLENYAILYVSLSLVERLELLYQLIRDNVQRAISVINNDLEGTNT